MAALGMATEVVRLRQLAGLPWLEGAAAGQLRSPIAGIGHPTGEAAARVVRFEGGSGLPGARREPGEPCELPNRPLYALRGHPRGALAVSFSHRGDLLAVVGGDIPEATLTVFRVDSGVPVATFAGHKGMVYDLDWSPEGDRLATASADLTAKVWAMPDLAERGQGAGHGGPRRLEVERACVVMQHASYVYASCFSTLPGDVGVVATGDFTGTLRLWDGREGVQARGGAGAGRLGAFTHRTGSHPSSRHTPAADQAAAGLVRVVPGLPPAGSAHLRRRRQGHGVRDRKRGSPALRGPGRVPGGPRPGPGSPDAAPGLGGGHRRGLRASPGGGA